MIKYLITSIIFVGLGMLLATSAGIGLGLILNKASYWELGLLILLWLSISTWFAETAYYRRKHKDEIKKLEEKLNAK